VKTKKLTIKTLQKNCVKHKKQFQPQFLRYWFKFNLVDGTSSTRSGNKSDNDSDNYCSSGGGCGGSDNQLL
jgi:hypothetical protein